MCVKTSRTHKFNIRYFYSVWIPHTVSIESVPQRLEGPVQHLVTLLGTYSNRTSVSTSRREQSRHEVYMGLHRKRMEAWPESGLRRGSSLRLRQSVKWTHCLPSCTLYKTWLPYTLEYHRSNTYPSDLKPIYMSLVSVTRRMTCDFLKGLVLTTFLLFFFFSHI